MRVIVWGLPLHSHTHSYVHNAFFRASKYMGLETLWLHNDLKSNEILRSDDVVISCGIEDNNLHLKHGVRYVLHNSDREDLRSEKYLNLQVYTHDVLERKVESYGNLTFWQNDNRTLYQPWATDLLPNEIEKLEPAVSADSKDVFWIGSIMDGVHGNQEEISQYASVCQLNKINFKLGRGASVEQNVDAIRQSRHSVAIQGKWQVDKGYIPCRIFKNISYGCWTFTNSKNVSDLLGINYHANLDEMFEQAEKHNVNPDMNRIREKMSLISKQHTYVNRLKTILDHIRE